MKNVVDDLMETIGGAFAPTIKQIAEMLSDFVRSIQPELTPILSIITDIVAKMLPAVMPLVNALLTLIKQVVTAIAPVTDAITNLVTNVVVAALPIISKLTELINKSISVWSDFAARIFNAMTPALTELLNASLPLIEAFVDLNIALMPLYTRILDTAAVMLEKLLPVITAVIAEVGRILAPLAKFESLLAGNKEGVDDYSVALTNCSDAYRSVITANSNYTNSVQEVQTETNKQLQKYDELVLKLTNINKSTSDAKTKHDQMKGAINELTSQYGVYLGKIDLEKMAWDEVAKSLKNARDRLIEYNVYLAYEKQIDALIEKVASLTIAFDELDKKRKASLPDLERYNTPEAQKYGQEYWGAMGGNPAWGARLASKSPSSEWGRAKSALDTAKKQLDEAYKNAEAARVKVQDIIDAIDKAQPVKTAAERTEEEAAKAKQQLDNLLKTVEEFINISKQGIKTSAAEDFANYVKAYDDTIAAIKDNLNVGIINQKKANDLTLSMQQAFTAHYTQIVKDMNSDVVDLYVEGAKSEQDKIKENYDKQKAIIEAKISEIQSIIEQTNQVQITLGVKDLDKQVSDLQSQIDLLNEALVNLGANMGREIEAAAAKEAEAATADVQKAQAQMHDFYQAQIDNIDALKLSQSDYLQYRTYLIDEEIAELQKLGFTEEELVSIRSAKIRQAEEDYKQWSQTNIKAMAEMESRLKDIAEHINDAILDDLANAFTDLLFSSKNFADSMKKMMHDMVTYMISEIMKLIVKMLMLKAVEASIGLFGTGGGGGGNVAPDLIGNIPIASYSGGARPAVASLGESSTVVKLLQKMSDIEQSIADNKPVVYTQLIEGVPLRNAVRKAEIQANIMGKK